MSEQEIVNCVTRPRPNVDENDIKCLATRLYGIYVEEICELNSFLDRSYLIQVDRNIKNPLLSNNCPHGYVMKIVNSLDSNKTDFIDGQTKLLLYLETKQIKCPKPVKNVLGDYFSVESLGTNKDKHVVRLLEFLPGKILLDVPITDYLVYQVGEFVAKFDNAIKNFEHDAYRSHKSLWMLENVSNLKEFLYTLKDEDKLNLVEPVIEDFTKNVVNQTDQFEKQIIHGDMNDQNILLSKSENDKSVYRVTGVLDFGDSSYTNVVYEIAIGMAYMMLWTGNIETGGLFLAGYNSVRIIPKHELNVLKTCVAARICQSLVLGTYTHTLNPENDYLLVTQKTGWALLSQLSLKTDEEILSIWTSASDNYLTKSLK